MSVGCIYAVLTGLTSPHIHSYWLCELAGGAVYLAQGPESEYVPPPQQLGILGPVPGPPSLSRHP